MTGKEYLSSLESVKTNKKQTDRITYLYGDDLPEIVLKMASNTKKSIFLDNNSRVLSYDEIVDAEKDLHIAFKEKGILPLIDCGENDFIVYHFVDKIWSKFNIIDETVFKRKKNLEELLK